MYKAEEEAGNSVNILFVTAEEPTKDMCLDRKPSFTISVGKTITISRSKIILDIVFNLLQKRGKEVIKPSKSFFLQGAEIDFTPQISARPK